MDTNTTRRQLLALGTSAAAYAAGAAIVAGGVALANEAKATTRGASPELQQRIAAARAASDASDHFDRAVWKPARDRFERMEAALPHYTFTATPKGYAGQFDRWSTAQTDWVAHAKVEVSRRVSFAGPGSDHAREFHGCLRRLVAAAEWRERKVHRCRVLSGVDAAGRESDRLGDVVCEAEDAVFAFRAQTITDLRHKLAFAAERGTSDNCDTASWIMADVRAIEREAQA